MQQCIAFLLLVQALGDDALSKSSRREFLAARLQANMTDNDHLHKSSTLLAYAGRKKGSHDSVQTKSEKHAQHDVEADSSLDSVLKAIPLGVTTMVLSALLAIVVLMLRSLFVLCFSSSSQCSVNQRCAKPETNSKYEQCAQDLKTSLLGGVSQTPVKSVCGTYGAVVSSPTSHLLINSITPVEKHDVQGEVDAQFVGLSKFSDQQKALPPQKGHETDDDQIKSVFQNPEFNMAHSDSPLITPRGVGPEAPINQRKARPSLSQWWEGPDDGESIGGDVAEVVYLRMHNSPSGTPEDRGKKVGDVSTQRRKRHSLSNWWDAQDEELVPSPNSASVLGGASPLRRHAKAQMS